MKKADTARWADYISRLAGTVTEAGYRSREDYAQAQAVFKDAESIYRNLARN